MDALADGSVALVVTSPPYFAGKQYEEELERDGVPSSYLEYLQMLTEVFAECVRTLEPGGRIAVNVANLGRKPYRSLSADVIRILEHDLGLLLRGELVWQKGEGANGSCAWGSFRNVGNPVLRDVSERVIVASKERFDRARTVAQRTADGLPHESTLMTDEFMALTLDVWTIPPERAAGRSSGAVPGRAARAALPAWLIVLDPFMERSLPPAGRRGYDLDAGYVRDRSRAGRAGAGRRHRRRNRATGWSTRTDRPEGGRAVPGGGGFSCRRAGPPCPGHRGQRELRGGTPRGGVVLRRRRPVPRYRGGLSRTDAVWRSLGRACAMRHARAGVPLVLLTTQLPRRPSEGDTALRAAGPDAVFDVVDCLRGGSGAVGPLRQGGLTGRPEPGFWTAADLARRQEA